MKKHFSPIPPKGKLRMHCYLGDQAGCGYIRVVIPTIILNQWRYKALSCDFSYNSHFIKDLSFYKECFAAKFQRSATKTHLDMISYLKANSKNTNTGLIYEIDDLLTPDIPETNHARPYYEQNWPIIQQILSTVHGITCSTEPLANIYRKYNSNVQVIENHLAPWLWLDVDVEQKIKNKSGKIRILWAGSQNHFKIDGSGGDFGKELIEFIQKTTDIYDWVLVGSLPYELKNNEKIEFHKWQHILDFGHYLRNLNCDIGIAPLENCLFNECKSNIKMLEFASLGIAGVYSDVAPYKKASLKAQSDTEMISHIEQLANDSKFRFDTWKKDREAVEDILYWNDKTIFDYLDKHFKLFGKTLIK